MPYMIGMDLTEVNFQLSNGQARLEDEKTFKDLFQFLVYQAAESSQDLLLRSPVDSHRIDQLSLC